LSASKAYVAALIQLATSAFVFNFQRGVNNRAAILQLLCKVNQADSEAICFAYGEAGRVDSKTARVRWWNISVLDSVAPKTNVRQQTEALQVIKEVL
jgi:hypothetical protein